MLGQALLPVVAFLKWLGGVLGNMVLAILLAVALLRLALRRMAMEKSKDSAIIAETVVDMGHNLGLRVCAEGVESEAVLAMLREFGCDFVQGFYFSAPVTADKVQAFVAAIDGLPDGDLDNWSQDAVA